MRRDRGHVGISVVTGLYIFVYISEIIDFYIYM